jgi:hypothetical protein
VREIDPVAEPVREIDPVAEPVQAIDQVVRAQVIDLVVAVVLRIGQVAAELELVPVAAAPVPDHRHDQLEALRRTKSVIAPLHHGLVQVPMEDLRAVAETTREPAAVEAVIAWAAVE